jgi:hypothetical protein
MAAHGRKKRRQPFSEIPADLLRISAQFDVPPPPALTARHIRRQRHRLTPPGSKLENALEPKPQIWLAAGLLIYLPVQCAHASQSPSR